MKKGTRILKVILGIVLFAALIGTSVFIIAGLIPAKDPVPGARKSVYVTMEDGTKIAVRYTLPAGMKKDEKVPAVMESTRYGTERKRSFLLNALMNLKIAKEIPPATIVKLLESKYAFVAVDARGSGASFGTRDMEFSKEEVSDMGQVIDWISKQPWSNGKVGAYGVSYSGNTAELATVSNHPALKAAVLMYPDFDVLAQSAAPGGIFNEFLVKNWCAANVITDSNKKDLFSSGIAPVSADKNGKQLKAAISSHQTIDMYEALAKTTYNDDALTGEYTAASLSPYIYKEEIEKSNVPLYVRVGWQDAGTVNGAIERFLTYKNPQTLVIGPWSHGGKHFSDPLTGKRVPQKELEDAQANEVVQFFDCYLKDDKSKAGDFNNSIRYYTFGEGEWNTTSTWPAAGFENKTLYFGPNGSLSENVPADASGRDSYKVDFTATTGENSRWRTNLGGGRILYPDRAEEDKKLLTYTSGVLENDMEITGVPVVTLNLSSTAADGAFYTYLEDVAPDGKVTYITEGQLRALHRKVTEADLGRAVLGPKHSFLKKDGELLKPGENEELKIGMHATSVLIKKGHRIRIAIAGHDTSNFRKIPENGDVVMEIHRNSALSSYAQLPMKVRN